MYKLFADDTTIYCSDLNIENCVKKINEDLVSINNWCQDNKMSINIKKIKYMLLGKKNMMNANKKKDLDVRVANEKLSKVNTFKHLGVHLDQNLTYNSPFPNQAISSAPLKFVSKRHTLSVKMAAQSYAKGLSMVGETAASKGENEQMYRFNHF